jgi:hypothetical protein
VPPKLTWTAATDQQILRRRAGGVSWDMIAAALGITRWAAIERGHHIGAQLQRARLPVPEDDATAPDPAREPLPPGHPISWDAVTAGTSLAGTSYPFPPLPPGS